MNSESTFINEVKRMLAHIRVLYYISELSLYCKNLRIKATQVLDVPRIWDLDTVLGD
jgi:hypothetical protein